MSETLVRYNSLLSELKSLEQDLIDIVEKNHYNAFMMYSNKVKFIEPKIFKEMLIRKEDK